MNAHPANPFSGLKGALAGLMSGGLMGLLLHLLFRRHFAPALAALEDLYARWRAGTLPPPAMPAPAAPHARPSGGPRRAPAGTSRAPGARRPMRAQAPRAVIRHTPQAARKVRHAPLLHASSPAPACPPHARSLNPGI